MVWNKTYSTNFGSLHFSTHLFRRGWNVKTWAFASAWASDEARSHGRERTKVRSGLISTGRSVEQSSSWKRRCCMDSRYIPTAAASSWMLFFTHSVLGWGILIGRFLCRQENYLLHNICPRNKHLDLYTMTCMTFLSFISLQLFFLLPLQKYGNDYGRLPRWKKQKTKKGRWGRSRGGGSGDK